MSRLYRAIPPTIFRVCRGLEKRQHLRWSRNTTASKRCMRMLQMSSRRARPRIFSNIGTRPWWAKNLRQLFWMRLSSMTLNRRNSTASHLCIRTKPIRCANVWNLRTCCPDLNMRTMQKKKHYHLQYWTMRWLQMHFCWIWKAGLHLHLHRQRPESQFPSLMESIWFIFRVPNNMRNRNWLLHLRMLWSASQSRMRLLYLRRLKWKRHCAICLHMAFRWIRIAIIFMTAPLQLIWSIRPSAIIRMIWLRRIISDNSFLQRMN